MGNVTLTAKFWLLLVAMCAGVAFVIVGALMPAEGDRSLVLITSGVGLIGTVVGYLTGNGRLIKAGEAPQPALQARDPQRRAEDRLEDGRP